MANSVFKMCLAIILILQCSAIAHGAQTDRDAIRYAETLDVATLDETLRSETLVNWLHSGPRLERLNWSARPNCDQKFVASHEATPEMPLCVQVSYSRGQVRGWLMIMVGTVDKGVSGKPFLKNGWVEVGSPSVQSTGKDEYSATLISRLSKLPLALDEVSYLVAHKEIVEYAKRIDIKTLDQALPEQRFDDWLYSGPAQSKRLSWGISFDCGTLPSNGPGKDSPICLTVVFGPDGLRAWITIQVGTFGEVPNGKPQVKSISVQPMAGREEEKRTCAMLSELPNLIATMLVTNGKKVT